MAVDLTGLDVGWLVSIAMESWAGRTYHMARVEKVCPHRLRVFWLDCSDRHGTSSYVPKDAIALVQPPTQPGRTVSNDRAR
jgi:hypothetical protein